VKSPKGDNHLNNMNLNKRQLIVGWIMILTIALLVTSTLFSLPGGNGNLAIRMFIYSQLIVIVLGLAMIYGLRDSNK
jgi:hypothetical protein